MEKAIEKKAFETQQLLSRKSINKICSHNRVLNVGWSEGVSIEPDIKNLKKILYGRAKIF
jgi:hypothetical protein